MHQSKDMPTRADEPALPVAAEGLPVIGAMVLGAALLTWLAWWLWAPAGMVIGAACLLLVLWAVWFFRDPPRRIPGASGLVLSPADGVVCFVGRAAPPPELGVAADGMVRVSVFMNVFNVHVNRSPVDGVVASVNYRAGRFFNASFDKASEHNERCSLRMTLPDGRDLVCVQIAGLVARRIVCRVKPGDALRAGQRFGLIRFGSRLDVYLPPGVEPRVRVGDRSVAGETIFAHLCEPGGGPPPRGEGG